MQCFFRTRRFRICRCIATVLNGKDVPPRQERIKKQGINDSNPMSDVKQFLVNVGNRKGLVCRDDSKIADSLML